MTMQHLRNACRTIQRLTLIAPILVTTLASAITSPNAPPPLNGIAHVAIRVRDLTASTPFYQRLGYEQAFALSRDGAVYESFLKINDRQFLELYPTTEKD